MAAAYISTNEGLTNTKKFRSAMDELLSWRRSVFGRNFILTSVRDTMLKMRDGDGSQDVHYALVTTKFGTASDAKSKALFLEIDTVCALQANGSATRDQISAAIDQLEGLTQA
jgi:hypothetical protein